MKIALYCPNKPLSHPNPSGDLIIARSLHQALNALGHECREIVRFRARWFWQTPRGWLNAAAAAIEALRASLSFRPHLWLTYHTYYKSPDSVGPWISRILGIPYVLFQPMFSTKRRRAMRTFPGFILNRIALEASSHAFTNNRNDIPGLERILGAGRVTYLAPGIFPEDFQRSEGCRAHVRREFGIPETLPLLMTAARFRADVKFESLVYLFHALSRVECDYRLLVVGDGPMEGQLHGLAERLLRGKTIFAGRAARKAMARYYSAADLFVFPGIGESLGMVFLEAQSCGLPVVALDTAGVPQVVLNGRTGLLAARDDGSALARAVERFLADRALREELGSNGARFVREERNLHQSYRELSRALEAVATEARPLP